MPLKVIGAGFGRTGTLSLKLALEHVGFGPCDHMQECFDHPERFTLWARALDQKDYGGAIDWEPLFHDYASTVDWPGAFFWRELATVHPQAKIILTVREPGSWYDSVSRTIYRLPRVLQAPAMHELVALAGLMSSRVHDANRILSDIIWQRIFDGRFADRDYAIAVMTAHNAAVERSIAPDRLLVFDVRDGWAPLCAFLGVPVPDVPFPHANDRRAFDQQVMQRVAPVAVAVAGGALIVAGAVITAIRARPQATKSRIRARTTARRR